MRSKHAWTVIVREADPIDIEELHEFCENYARAIFDKAIAAEKSRLGGDGGDGDRDDDR